MKRKYKQVYAILVAFVIIAAAYTCRMLAMYDIGGKYPSNIRAVLYLLLFALWGYSIDRRILQKQALHCLRLIAAFMLFWLILRTLKYEVVTDLTVARYLWYLYYLPMLFIPLLGMYTALCLGQPEDYRMNLKKRMLAVIPIVLFACVITNDLHQHVFAFSSGVPGVPDNYSYSHCLLYFVSILWMVGCILCSLICFWKKSRIPGSNKRRLMPFGIACLMILYAVLYLTDVSGVRWLFGDMNVMFCLLYAAIYESCIYCRMIQSNTGYAELFEATTLAACITDREGHIVLRSQAAKTDVICPQQVGSILYKDEMRISSAPISGGYVVWQDNIRQLSQLQVRLSKNRMVLNENKKKLQEAYLVQKKLYELTEKNRIYDELETRYAEQTSHIRQLVAQCKNADATEQKRLMKRILLLGTYIKRSVNLRFLCREYELLPQQEIRLTVDEAVRAMTACGTECGVVYRTTGPMRATEVQRLFDLLKDVAEHAIDELQSLFISVSDSEMDLSVECAADLSVFATRKVTVCNEDGLWLIRTQIGG